MKFIETKLAGAYIVEMDSFSDDRGLFSRIYCERELAEKAGFEGHFVNQNHSVSYKKGTMRGLHYQLPPDNESKFIKCVKGRIFDVFVDLRKGSPTFLEWVGVELSAENMKMALMPEGFAHGFVSLEDNSEAIYMSSSFYAPQSERGIRFNDPRINIEWPVPVEIYTDKDISHPDVAEDFEGIEIESFLAKVN